MPPRKIRTDSFHTQAEMAAAKPPEPPKHIELRPGDKPFWDAIVRAREYNSWTETELEHIANLARCKADIERLQKRLDEEGDIVENARGTQIVNPIHSLMETLSRRSVALTRLLMVHAQATNGAPHEVKKRNAKQREIQRTVGTKSDEDDLLARPAQH